MILGSLGNDSKKPTVCVYGHLDVQPALKSDGWDTEPFELTLKDGKLYGRGSTDDKGPAISWLHVVEAYNKTNNELPVNLKVVSSDLAPSCHLLKCMVTDLVFSFVSKVWKRVVVKG